MKRALALLPTVVLLAACNTVRQVEIRTEPSDAAIRVDGEEIGKSPVTYGFDFADPDAMYTVTAEKEGYVTRKKRISQLRLDVAADSREAEGEPEGPEYVVLEIDEDEAWTKTTPSEAANAWVEIEVNPALDETQVWELLVDTVTEHYELAPARDPESGYIATKEKVVRFSRGPTATVQVKNAFFSKIAHKTPLIYEVTFKSQIQENGEWTDFPRIFEEDAPLLDAVRTRLVGQ